VNIHVLYDLWTGIGELGMNECMNHGFSIGWILAWDYYVW